MHTKINLTLMFLLVCLMSNAAVVDTIETYSPSMSKKIPCVVITPDQYAKGKDFPVLYLLHGYSDCYNKWIKTDPYLKNISDLYNFIIVCPDGATSWYMDSPVNPSLKYETYISDELVKWIDKHYKTIRDRKGRAITGLSMGGHGALFLAFRHQDIYGAAGSMSGGVDIRPFPNSADLPKCLGSYAENKENWENNTVMSQLYRLTPNSLHIIIDCGTEDFFYNVNMKLHEELLFRNIPHDFITRPGMHNWNYWINSIKYQSLFFSDYFQSSK